jgi:PAS domain S-box-containing protein
MSGMNDELLDIALSAGGMASWRIDLATNWLEVDTRLGDMIGRPPGPLSLTGFVRCFYPDDQPQLEEALEHARGGEPMDCRLRVRRNKLEIHALRLVGRAGSDWAGRCTHIQGVLHDAEAGLLPQGYLADGQSPWKRMFDTAGVGLAQVDAQTGRLLRVNRAFVSVMGCLEQGWAGRRLSALTPVPERAACEQAMREMRQGRLLRYIADHQLQHADGHGVWAQVIVTVEPTEQETPSHLMAVIVPMDERMRAEHSKDESMKKLHRAHHDIEQQLQHRTVELASTHAALVSEITGRQMAEQSSRDLLSGMVQSVEDERRRISRELHDTLGQQLTLLAVHLKGIEQHVADRPQAADRLKRLFGAVEEMENQVDRLAHDLRPSTLDDLGLEEAMRSHIEAWSHETGVACELHTYGLGADRLPTVLESTVYRVMQEALTNVHKHARARRVGVIVERSHRKLRMVLEDDGVGFDSAAPRRAGQLGLLGMAERAALIAGKLEVESVPGRGTTVYLSMPVADGSESLDAA